MLTTSITNDHFHTRINELISNHLSGSTVPTVDPLTNLDTDLGPDNITSSLLGFTSSWIDICSPDPLISGISRQILLIEVAYAAFCGIDFLFIRGPRLHHRDPVSQKDLVTHNGNEYALAIQESLGIGHSLQISIVMPMTDENDESDKSGAGLKARDQFLEDIEEEMSEKTDGLGTWDAWNAIRTVCKYHSRLHVGKKQCKSFSLIYRHLLNPLQGMVSLSERN